MENRVLRPLASLFICFAPGAGSMSEESGTIVFTGSDSDDQLSVIDILDHVLNQGVILRGNLIISLAGVDLVYVGLDVILTSVETAMRHIEAASLPAGK